MEEFLSANSCIFVALCLDPLSHPPLLRKTKNDFDTSGSTSDYFYSSSSRHRQVIVGLASSIVNICFTENGKIALTFQLNYPNHFLSES